MESLLSSTPLDLLIALDRIDLQDKYREVITRRPRDVPALLRSLYREGKLLDHNALLISTLDAIHPRGDQLKELLLGGLHNVFVDILTDHTVYATFEGFLGGLIFGLAEIVLALVGELRGQRMGENPIVDQLLTRSVELWEMIWSKRSLLQGETTSDRDYQKAVKNLAASWNVMMNQNNFSSENPLCTRLGHVAIYCWYYLPQPTLSSRNTRGNDLLAVLISQFLSGCSQQTRDQLVQEAIVDTFGPQAWVQRLRRALEDPGCLNDRLGRIIDVINYFGSHPHVRQMLWVCKIQECIFVALKRQQLFGDAANEWPIFAEAPTSIGWMLADHAPISAYELIIHHNIFKWTARALILGAESPIQPTTSDSPHLLHHWLYILNAYTDVFRSNIAKPAATAEGAVRAAKPPRSAIIMANAARKVWYRTLLDLRALHPSADNPMPSRQRALEAWTSFGHDLGLVESEERTRWEKARNTQSRPPQEAEASSSSAPRALQRYCSWRQCEYHTKEPRYPMMQCARCGDSRYCGRSCQTNDWKHGGHRLVCYARKE